MRILLRPLARQARGASLGANVRLLLQTALALLALSVVIGVIDGQRRLAAVASNVSATHAHAGALGWIELSVIALALMLFGGMLSPLELRGARVVSVGAAASVCGYVLATLAGSPIARVIFAAAVVLSIVAFLGWLGMRAPQIQLSLPHLTLLLAALALVFGTTIGALLEVQAAGTVTYFPGGSDLAHPLVLATGYQTLAAMAIAEWRLRPSPGRWPPLGVAQVTLAFGAALALAIGVLLGMTALLPLALVLEIAAGMLFAVRFAPRMRHVRWLERSGERHFALSAVFLVAYLALFTYLLGKVTLRLYPSVADIPTSLTTANSHLLLLGVMTNALIGVLFETTSERQGFWPATEELLFWGMNLGLLGFVAGLVVHNSMLALMLQGIWTPILGACLLAGAIAYSVRLQTAHVRLETTAPIQAIKDS